MDVGRPSQLIQASQSVVDGRVATELPLTRVGEGTTIAPSARVDRLTVIGRDCKIGSGARIEASILFDNVTILANATLRRAIVDDQTLVDESASFVDAVLPLADLVASD